VEKMIELFFDILEALVVFLQISVFATVLMSWVSPEGKGSINEILHQITEPILGPVRKIVPPLGMFDFTPMIAIFILQFPVMIIIRFLESAL